MQDVAADAREAVREGDVPRAAAVLEDEVAVQESINTRKGVDR